MNKNTTKTYADDFFEKYPDAPRSDGGKRPMICRYYLYPEGCLDEHGRCKGDPRDESCTVCWSEVMKSKRD